MFQFFIFPNLTQTEFTIIQSAVFQALLWPPSSGCHLLCEGGGALLGNAQI